MLFGQDGEGGPILLQNVCVRSLILSVRIYNRFGRGGGPQGGAKADVSTSASLAFAKLIVAAQLIRPAEKVPVVKEPLPGGDNDRFAKIFERLAKLPAGHKPRAGDFASAVWEFGREALVKLEEQKRTEIVFGDKYHKLSWSKEHPILTAVYE